MRRTWFWISAFLALALLPIVIRQVYLRWTRIPRQLTIATGPRGGRYFAIGQDLAAEIQSRHPVTVVARGTSGSLENLQLLANGEVDFALYQPATLEIIRSHDPDVVKRAGLEPAPSGLKDVRFVANLYSQPAHFIVRSDAGINSPSDLEGRTVSLGLPASGDYAMSLLLLEHFGVSRDRIQARRLPYAEVQQGFADGSLDAALITVGIQSPIYRDLCQGGRCDFRSLPFARALTRHHVSLSEYTIPAGLYRTRPSAKPERDVHTVAFRAQLLTRAQVPKRLVNEVTRIAMNEDFVKRSRLSELFEQGAEFARSKPEFAMHKGALDFHDPNLHPILNSEFVEATEGMRSFIVSALIAAYLIYRWARRRATLKKEHRLDRYIRSLLEIERRQLDLDEGSGVSDVEQLQQMLDEVTKLRQEALQEFSAHQISEDRAADCFVEMCHALSNKINAKLSRQRLDLSFRELVEAVKASPRGGECDS